MNNLFFNPYICFIFFFSTSFNRMYMKTGVCIEQYMYVFYHIPFYYFLFIISFLLHFFLFFDTAFFCQQNILTLKKILSVYKQFVICVTLYLFRIVRKVKRGILPNS